MPAAEPTWGEPHRPRGSQNLLILQVLPPIEWELMLILREVSVAISKAKANSLLFATPGLLNLLEERSEIGPATAFRCGQLAALQ